jgi:hypothetical protein
MDTSEDFLLCFPYLDINGYPNSSGRSNDANPGHGLCPTRARAAEAGYLAKLRQRRRRAFGGPPRGSHHGPFPVLSSIYVLSESQEQYVERRQLFFGADKNCSVVDEGGNDAKAR